VQPGFEIGDSVRVINSAWVNNPVGVIREIDVSKQTVKISIPEFMNGTPVSMDFTDIAKI
jgi:transcription antitermination factor NusG